MLDNNKGERWSRQIMRAELIHLILECYDPFYMINIQSGCLRNQLSYKDAEKTANIFSEIFNLDCKATDLMDTDDNLSNKIIDEHLKLKKHLATIESRNFPFTKEDMMFFMKYEYYNNPLLNMKHIEWSTFSIWCILAAKRACDVKDVKLHCIEVQIWGGGRLKQVDTRLFRKGFIRLEKDFWEIVAKRMLRERKKQK